MGEGVTCEFLLPASSCPGGGGTGVTVKPLGPRLLLGVMGDCSVDAIIGCFVFGRIWSEWAGTGESMRNIGLMVM